VPTLLSIQTGKPKTYGTPHAPDPNERTWRTAIVKQPVLGEVWLGEESLDGDDVANKEFHGGPDNAVLCYSADHYPLWQHEWGMNEALPCGGFGENFTISGLDEQNVCLGDVYAIGDVRIQVSGPRKPCYKLERRWRRYDLIKRVTETNRGGWYARVLKTGFVSAGLGVDLSERPRPAWTIARVSEVSYSRRRREEVHELLAFPELATRWRSWVLGKLERAQAHA
jgi:MOSC domain-containing protein YiiM